MITENIFNCTSATRTWLQLMGASGVREGVLQDRDMSSVTGVAMTKACAHQPAFGTCCREPKCTPEPWGLCTFSSLLLPRRGALSTPPVMMHLGGSEGVFHPSRNPAETDLSVCREGPLRSFRDQSSTEGKVLWLNQSSFSFSCLPPSLLIL